MSKETESQFRRIGESAWAIVKHCKAIEKEPQNKDVLVQNLRDWFDRLESEMLELP
jgi:hypothetical protein